MKMRDDKDHNERLDDFSGYMRQRLEEHRLPVDAGGWDEVEARMNRRARSRGWLWTGGRRRSAGFGYLAATFPGEDAIGGIEPLSERDIGESGGNEYSSGASGFTYRIWKETYGESAEMGKKG
jgi:hypothetical protein